MAFIYNIDYNIVTQVQIGDIWLEQYKPRRFINKTNGIIVKVIVDDDTIDIHNFENIRIGDHICIKKEDNNFTFCGNKNNCSKKICQELIENTKKYYYGNSMQDDTYPQA